MKKSLVFLGAILGLNLVISAAHAAAFEPSVDPLASYEPGDDKIPVSGEIVLKDGTKLFKIEIGKTPSDSKEMAFRIVQLERAVSELQYRVFQLENEPNIKVKKESWVCSLASTGFGHTTYFGRGDTKSKAQEDVLNKCKAGESFSHYCQIDNARCEIE